jgi:hypothetical protein
MYLLVFHAYTHINEMHGSRSKIPSKKSRPYICDVKFLALLGAPYMYDISRLRVNFETLNFQIIYNRLFFVVFFNTLCLSLCIDLLYIYMEGEWLNTRIG